MLNKALSKIKDEMAKNQKNGYIQVVGRYLMQHLAANPGCAEKIMAADKTVAKSLDKMREEARKKQSGNCAVLTDEEGFAVVLKYFGMEGTPSGTSVQVPAPRPAAPAPVSATDFDIKLEDLL